MNGSATWSFMMFACELCGTFFCVCVASRFIAMPHCRCCVLHSLQFEIMCGALIRFWLKLLTTASSAICSYFSSVMLQFGEWNIIFHVWKREKERSIFPMAKVWMEAMSAVEFFFREEKKSEKLSYFFAIHNISWERKIHRFFRFSLRSMKYSFELFWMDLLTWKWWMESGVMKKCLWWKKKKEMKDIEIFVRLKTAKTRSFHYIEFSNNETVIYNLQSTSYKCLHQQTSVYD